jgi:NhaP-type Na+/H+ or K+/H+ antiporter
VDLPDLLAAAALRRRLEHRLAGVQGQRAPIGLLAIGLVVFTTAIVAVVAHA